MFRKILYLFTVIFILLLGYLIFDFWSYKKEQNEIVIEKGQVTTAELTTQINTILQKVIKETNALADLLNNRSFTKKELETLITNRSQELDEILGITVAFEPFAFDPEIELYSPYFDKKQNKLIFIEDTYNYTDKKLKTAQWYVKIKEEGAQWTEPYFAEAAQELVSDYCIPIYFSKGKNKGQIKGVIALTISLKGFTKLIHSLSLGKTGLGFVSSSKGILLAHPVSEFIGKKKISNLIESESKVEVITAYQSILEGKKGFKEFFDEEKKQNTLFFYDKVPLSNWGIGVMFFKNDMLGDDIENKRKYIHISITVSLLLFFLLAVFYNRDYLSVSEIWYLSFFATVVLILNIIFVGYLQHTGKNVRGSSETLPIADNTTLSNFINEQTNKANELKLDSVIPVPTGIYIERLEFGDSYNLNISGKLWQKYDTITIKKINPGFRLPQIAPFAESSFIEESYKDFYEDKVLIGYDFRTTVRLNFAYDHYPFDNRHISLEIQPINNQNTVLLVPDLKSYTYTNPSQKGGIDPDIKLPGSKIIESYFTYKTNIYNTDFGYDSKDALRAYPQLHYNINVKRILITAFITYLIPIFVTLIMMFILIYATEKSEDGQAGGGIVQGMAAFFFVLIFSHIDLRKDILTADLVYMEYFYFIAYIMIILSTYNLIIYSRMKNKLFDYKNNLIVKTTFWPVFLSLVLLMTLIKFY